jgi:hypothetical protein
MADPLPLPEILPPALRRSARALLRDAAASGADGQVTLSPREADRVAGYLRLAAEVLDVAADAWHAWHVVYPELALASGGAEGFAPLAAAMQQLGRTVAFAHRPPGLVK